MKIPKRRYCGTLGRMQPEVYDVEAAKEDGWKEQRILVVHEDDQRLDFVEREYVRRIGERLYGKGAARG